MTTDGTIVVANSYGLAYIPESVQLPDQVILASADDAIPAAQRARWATYPMVALEDWAAYRQKPLRAVIATAAQLAGSDSGAATVVLAPDDIPEHGAMVGRSRLGVVDPHAAERLAATPDSGLARLLAPTRNATGPANPLHMLWRDVMTPLARSATSRQGEHLKAFHTYAAAARESCLMQARTPASPGTNTDAVRTAIADWLYWKHIARLLDAAMTPVSQGSAR